MSITATITSTVSVAESYSTTAPSVNTSSAQSVTYLDATALSLTANTGVPATTVVKFRKTLSGSTGSIDLTSLTDVLKGSVSLSGLKVQAIKITAKSDNANDFSVTVGASNGYQLSGSDFKVTLKAGQTVLLTGNEQTPDVGGSAKVFDLAGTSGQSIDVIIVAG